MSYKILVTNNFTKQFKQLAKKYSSAKEDIEELMTSLEKNPFQGDSLGKNCYKIRLAITSKGKGKAGGARVITYIYIYKSEVILLTIYDKSKKESISNEELMELLKNLH
jgi:mRNA-degrading endonuclease RelE of RelBE toxin-antitoxin system